MVAQGGLKAGFRYSVAVGAPKPQHRPKTLKAAAPPRPLTLPEAQDGFQSIEACLRILASLKYTVL